MSAMLEFVNFYLIPGLVVGSIYALGAIGVSLLFGILRFAHFSHGDMMTLGAYLGLPFIVILNLHPILGAFLAAFFVAVIALFIDASVYAPMRHRSTIVSVMASFGVALMIRSLVQLIWGVDIISYSAGFISKPLMIGIFRIQEKHIWIILITVALMLVTHLLLAHTKTGKAMRALSDNPELSRLTGIPTGKIIRITWILGGGLAAIGGVFAGWDTQLQSMLGWHMLLPIFAATILGGIGRPYGAMLGGVVIGVVEEIAVYPWIGDDALVDPSYMTGIAFAVMVLMLIVRPTGIFGGRVF